MRTFTTLAMLAVAIGCGATTTETGDSLGTGGTTSTGGTSSGTPTGGTTTGVPADLELGDGEFEHTAVSQGTDVGLVFGPQGGYHIWVSGQVTGMGPIVAISAWATNLADGTRVAEVGVQTAAWTQLADYDDVADTGWFAGVKCFLLDNADPFVCAIDGAEIEVCASVMSAADQTKTVQACVPGFAVIDPASPADCSLY